MDLTNSPVLLGLDVGTSGVRALAVTAEGDILAETRAPLADLPAPAPAHEQDPSAWWRAVCSTLRELRQELGSGGLGTEIAGISVTSTSGSLLLAGSTGEPLRPAILYDDARAAAIARQLSRQLPAGEAPVNASFSLAKAVWLRQQEPSAWSRTTYLLHPADWLSGKLIGDFGISDYANALKLGYDPEEGNWSAAVGVAALPPEMLPRVVAPGQQIGQVSAQASAETGLNAGIPVIAGASDGLASLIGSGASQPGDANTTLGTTLVWKALARAKPRLESGMYCHLLPNGLWAPGAASNTGPGTLRHPSLALSGIKHQAAATFPVSILCYPLGNRGERFPFSNPTADGFVEGTPASPDEEYAAQLQSLACIERWGYERLAECGVSVGAKVFSAGGAAANPVLSQLRANLLQRTVVRCVNPTASLGAAILAAGAVVFGGDLTAAMRRMTRPAESFEPEPASPARFEECYRLFRAACARRGYV